MSTPSRIPRCVWDIFSMILPQSLVSLIFLNMQMRKLVYGYWIKRHVKLFSDDIITCNKDSLGQS